MSLEKQRLGKERGELRLLSLSCWYLDPPFHIGFSDKNKDKWICIVYEFLFLYDEKIAGSSSVFRPWHCKKSSEWVVMSHERVGFEASLACLRE